MLYQLFLNTNILVSIYIFCIISILIGGCLLNIVYKFVPLPLAFCELCKYGKLLDGSTLNKYVLKIQVPKRWFLHFYIVAFVEAFCSIYLVWTISLSKSQCPYWLQFSLNILTLPERIPAINSVTACIVVGLYFIHISRRLYESLYLSVFSSTTMNLGHYFLGLFHYSAAITLLLSLFPGFSNYDQNFSKFDSFAIDALQIIGILFVLIGSYVQHDSLNRLASLRLCQKGLTEKYFMPSGGLFNFISCPHMLSEIVIYIGLSAVMNFQHRYFNFVCLFVACNQIQIAIMNHHWYKLNFKDYPLKRKAILPFFL